MTGRRLFLHFVLVHVYVDDVHVHVVDFLSDDYWVVGFRMLSEPSQGSGDDSTTNNIELVCRGPGLNGDDTEYVTANGDDNSGSVWGSYSVQCQLGRAVSALQTKYETDQGLAGDDTAIGDVRMYCGDF